jgi:hypothetical protein
VPNFSDKEVFYMVSTVDPARATEKWVARASVAQGDYEKGIASPKKSWSSATQAAKSTFQQAVTAGDIGDRFARGVSAAGDAKWSTMAREKGVGRFSDGVNKSQGYFNQGISGVISTIRGVTLAQRGPRGAAQNYDNVKKIGDALHAARISRAISGSK